MGEGGEMDINELCKRTNNAEMLNALHACRDGHPRNHAHQWRNAYGMASQYPADFKASDIAWLKSQAELEEVTV